MRVGVDFRPPLFSRTGIARSAAELVRGLGAHSGEVDLHLYGDSWRAVDDPARVGELVEASHGRLHRRRIPGRVTRWFGRVGGGVEWRTGRLDVFHFTDIVYPPVRHARRVMTLHDVVFEVDPRFHDASFLGDVPQRVRRAVEAADWVVTSSEETRARILECYPIDAERVTAIPLGADHVLYEDDASWPEDGEDADVPFVLFVSTIEPRKNHAKLLDAFVRFRRHHPHRLVLVGGFGWMCDEVRRRLLDGVDGVRHLTAIDDRALAALYRRAQFTVYPSFYEGFGLPVLESMALGAPVLTTRRGAIPEVGGDAVRYCDPDDPASIAAEMEWLADHPLERADLAQRGRRRAEGFRWADTARRHVELYRRVLDA